MTREELEMLTVPLRLLHTSSGARYDWIRERLTRVPGGAGYEPTPWSARSLEMDIAAGFFTVLMDPRLTVPEGL